jgi:hypothetical protein
MVQSAVSCIEVHPVILEMKYTVRTASYAARHLANDAQRTLELSGPTSSRVAQSVQCLTTEWTAGVRSPKEAEDFSSNLCVQTCSGAHPASCTMGTGGSFPGVKRGRGVMLSTHPLLVPRLRKSRSYTSCHPNAPLWSVTEPLYLFNFYQAHLHPSPPPYVRTLQQLATRRRPKIVRMQRPVTWAEKSAIATVLLLMLSEATQPNSDVLTQRHHCFPNASRPDVLTWAVHTTSSKNEWIMNECTGQY